jgi:hypothetical protein
LTEEVKVLNWDQVMVPDLVPLTEFGMADQKAYLKEAMKAHWMEAMKV